MSIIISIESISYFQCTFLKETLRKTQKHIQYVKNEFLQCKKNQFFYLNTKKSSMYQCLTYFSDFIIFMHNVQSVPMKKKIQIYLKNNNLWNKNKSHFKIILSRNCFYNLTLLIFFMLKQR